MTDEGSAGLDALGFPMDEEGMATEELVWGARLHDLMHCLKARIWEVMTEEEFSWLRRELLIPEVEIFVRMMARGAWCPEQKKRILEHPWESIQELHVCSVGTYQETFRIFAGHLLLSRYILLDYCRGNSFRLTRSQRRHYRKLCMIHWSRAVRTYNKFCRWFLFSKEDDVLEDDLVFVRLLTLLDDLMTKNRMV